ncbi:hypothetical protein IMSAGC019_00323 [Lachnospiraceae bacterium]|nr:hypothetical protein IMSAGC019_00323 [Lachnospiraceae bacterium]
MAEAQKQPIPGKPPGRPVKKADQGAGRPVHLDIMPLRRPRINTGQYILHKHIIVKVIKKIKLSCCQHSQQQGHCQGSQPILSQFTRQIFKHHRIPLLFPQYIPPALPSAGRTWAAAAASRFPSWCTYPPRKTAQTEGPQALNGGGHNGTPP